MVATGRQFKAGPNIRVRLNNVGFIAMRKDAKLVSILRVRGETWVSRLNEELHRAQQARKQPIADGYTYYIHDSGTRARLYILATTARAQAHERKHSSILKLMETSRYDVKTRGQLERAVVRKAAAKKAAATRKQRRIIAADHDFHASGTN